MNWLTLLKIRQIIENEIPENYISLNDLIDFLSDKFYTDNEITDKYIKSLVSELTKCNHHFLKD